VRFCVIFVKKIISMKVTKNKKVIETLTYHLTDEIKYVKEFVNSKEKKRFLKYTGRKIYGYDLTPLYDKDISVLQKWNPSWGSGDGTNVGYEFFEQKVLPEPEDIDVNKIIFSQFARHAFFDINKEPIPVVVMGDSCRCHLDNYFYHLDELKKHLDTHPNVVYCSDIYDIEYYNATSYRDKQIRVLILPTVNELKMAYTSKINLDDVVFYKPYIADDYDFLNIKQFVKNTTYK
jgi:hypothetical protein